MHRKRVFVFRLVGPSAFCCLVNFRQLEGRTTNIFHAATASRAMRDLACFDATNGQIQGDGARLE
eukprot:2697839-Pleurochrysis_carterae.AAC.2